MVNIIKVNLEIEKSLKNKIDIICSFTNITPTIINGCIRKIDEINYSMRFHKFLIFYYSTEIYIKSIWQD